jgi:hypothetical protein
MLTGKENQFILFVRSGWAKERQAAFTLSVHHLGWAKPTFDQLLKLLYFGSGNGQVQLSFLAGWFLVYPFRILFDSEIIRFDYDIFR